jgi:hypothetical protein
MTAVIAGTKMGDTNSEYMIVLFKTLDATQAPFDNLKYIYLSFMQTTG